MCISKWRKITVPLKPLKTEDLPINIQNILAENLVNIDVTLSQVISVQHAY